MEPKGPFPLDFAGESAILLFDGALVYFGELAKPDSSAHKSGLIGPVGVMRILYFVSMKSQDIQQTLS